MVRWMCIPLFCLSLVACSEDGGDDDKTAGKLSALNSVQSLKTCSNATCPSVANADVYCVSAADLGAFLIGVEGFVDELNQLGSDCASLNTSCDAQGESGSAIACAR